MNQMKFAKAYTKAVGKEGKLVGVIGSTATVDRYGEIIDQGSWDLKHYKKNPVILWAHNLTLGEDRPPIGKATKVGVKNGELVFDIQFDMSDPFAADIFRKYEEGFLRAFSVGFIPHKIERSTDGSDAPILKENELLELSAVPVPANPEALNALKARSFQARSWNTMVKEAEDAQEQDQKDLEEEEDEEEIEDPEKIEDEDVEVVEETETVTTDEETTETGEETPTETPITDVTPEATPESKGGSTADPRKAQQDGNRKLVEVLRKTTTMIQGALAEYNRQKKNDA